MRKSLYPMIIVLFLSILLCYPVKAKNDEWNEKPTITHIYELSKEKVFLEWEGKADLYQIYVDGKNISTVNLQNAIIEIKPGGHQIVIVPIKYVSKNVDTSVSLGLQIVQFGGNGSIDLGALGVDPKDLVQGNASEICKINYNVSPILNAVPEIIKAITDFEDNVLLSFTDKYDSNVYRIEIKNGHDINYLEFDTLSEEASALISKEKTIVTIKLNPDYLKLFGCMVPELDQKYSFSVKLQKHPMNYIDRTNETNIILESKESKAYEYTPYAAWKNPPAVTYASQSADGQITLQWDHDDNGLGCEYKIMEQDVLLGVKKGEKEIGRTTEKEFTVSDLMNGKYTYAVIPLLSVEEGISSEPATAEVKNNWVEAPSLQCKAEDQGHVQLNWQAAEGVESYHITVSAGSGSLLRFVKLDYKVYEEFDVETEEGNVTYTYIYDQPVDPENGTNLKFEICGIRHAADGSEQRSASTTQTITLK